MRAALFDMDGVLVDSEAVNVKLLGEYLERQGIAVPEQVIWDHIGAPGRPFWECAGRLNPGLDAGVSGAQTGAGHLLSGDSLPYGEGAFDGVKGGGLEDRPGLLHGPSDGGGDTGAVRNPGLFRRAGVRG